MRSAVVPVLLVIALARFAQVSYTGLTYNVGDFYSTLPGAYVETFNPTLWASPDLVDEVGKRPSYRRGPTQLLTTLPLSWLDSYREIALALLVVYGLLIPASAWLMWRSFGGETRDRTLLALVVSTSLLFYPTLVAYIAREFEVVLLAATVALVAAARADRLWATGAWTAYLALFKYLPLGLLPLFVARRWWKALAGCAVAAAVILALAHPLFGLQNFSSDGFVGGYITNLLPTDTEAFCMAYKDTHYVSHGHEASIRFALCSLRPFIPVRPIVPYAALILVTLAALAAGYLRAERAAPLSADAERWRRTWEISAVMIVYTTYVYAHYYYLIFLIMPLTAVMVRAYQQRRAGLWAAWGVSYFLLSGFLVPMSWLTRVLQADAFTWYLQTLAYLPGILLLQGTILAEYIRLGTEASASRPEPSAR